FDGMGEFGGGNSVEILGGGNVYRCRGVGGGGGVGEARVLES
ncbi:hypothetical protein A2U01_0013101, partial [Trifolium medium]|nr:hypothetical protein [Trifolium medium]